MTKCGNDLIRKKFKDNLFKYYLWKTTELSNESANDMFYVFNSITWDCYNLYGHMNEKQTVEYDEVVESIELVNECKAFKYLWE